VESSQLIMGFVLLKVLKTVRCHPQSGKKCIRSGSYQQTLDFNQLLLKIYRLKFA
jgi:hypothetical protein